MGANDCDSMGYQMTKCAEEKPYFWVPELLIDPLKCLLISCRSVLALSFASFRIACGAFQDHYHNNCRVQCHNAMAWPPLVPDFQMRGIPLWTATLVIRPGFGNSRKGNLFHMSCVTIGLRLLRVTVEHRHTRPVGLPRAPVRGFFRKSQNFLFILLRKVPLFYCRGAGDDPLHRGGIFLPRPQGPFQDILTIFLIFTHFYMSPDPSDQKNFRSVVLRTTAFLFSKFTPETLSFLVLM